MRKIDKLLHISMVPPFLIALAVLTFVVFMQELGRLSELLITRNASPEAVLIIAGSVAPGVLIFSLPLSFLIGTLIGLSGLSGEYQVTALRACGVPLRRMLQPVVALGVLVGLATAIMSVIVLPETNDILDSLKDLISIRQATSQIVPRAFNEFPNVVFYLDDLSIDRQHWDRVFLADNSDPQTPRIVMAREGTWVSDNAGLRLQMPLVRGTVYEVNPQDPSKDNISEFAATDIPINRDSGISSEGANQQRTKDPPEQSTLDLWRGSQGINSAQRRDELIELHKRLALPCSVLGFAFVGLSLGACTRGGGRTSGSVLSLVLALLFYVMFFNGIRLAKTDTVPPWLGLWGADIILLGIGVVMLINAEQNGWLAQCAANWRWKPRLEALARRLHLRLIRPAFERSNGFAAATARKWFPKVLDSYIYKGFLGYFFWSILICYSLFVVLTLFDLLDEIIRHKIAVAIVVRYFTFLTPHILLLVIPMAVLLAILILFGILEKGSEVTAMKAGGWSLYRIALPVILVSAVICAGVYFMQDYVLPSANKRQDELRNLIKARPPQTTARPRKWIFGESNDSDRIFNYDYFDPNKDVFVGLNVYEVDLHQLAIKRRIHARQATIDAQGSWVLEDGWVRDFQPAHMGFQPISKANFAFPEKASYFKKEIFEPRESAKLTYFELKDYIDYLKQSGYNATELQVQLHMKISFPLSCFVMALIGVPFSFFMGKRGAFFGITASVAIAMSYWGIFRIFEQMGAYGLLTPVLAAWAPNLMFGAAGLALLFTIKT